MPTDSDDSSAHTVDYGQSRVPAPANVSVSLLHLPDELLSEIVAQAAEQSLVSSLARLALVCKRLHPVVQQALYRKVVIGAKDTERLALLTRSFLDRPTNLALVHNLRADLQAFAPVSHDDGQGTAESRALTRSPAAFFSSLRLPQLSDLALESVEPKVLSDLLAAKLPSATPNLQRLRVLIGSTGRLRDVDWFPLLARLPRLKSLDIDACRSALVLPPDTMGLVSLSQLESLHIRGKIVSRAASARLCRLTPNLRQLTVLDGGSAALHLLAGAPASVKRLGLYYCGKVAIEEILDRFLDLETLHVGPGFSPDWLLPLLSSSLITRLGFDWHSPATDNFVLAIVDGPQRMPRLRSLTLQHADCGAAGEYLREVLHYLDGATAETIKARVRSLRGDYEPYFQTGCTPDGLARVVRSATGNGILVSGGALECIDWYADFQRQLEQYFIERTATTQDSTVMDRYYAPD